MFVLKVKTQKSDKSWIDRFDRVHFVHVVLDKFMHVLHAHLDPKNFYIAVEGYSFGSRGNAVTTMAEVKQAILTTIRVHRGPAFVNVTLFAPTTWRSCIMGEDHVRGLKKPDVIEWMKRRWPVVQHFGSDHNVYDSYAMAQLYFQIVMLPHKRNKSIDRLLEREKGRSWLPQQATGRKRNAAKGIRLVRSRSV